MRFTLLALALLSVPAVAQAAAPVYFDLGGAIGVIGAYLIGLILFFAAALSGRLSGKRWVAVFILYLMAPGLLLAVDSVHRSQARTKAGEVEKMRISARRDAEVALMKFCKTNPNASAVPACERIQQLSDGEPLIVGRQK